MAGDAQLLADRQAHRSQAHREPAVPLPHVSAAQSLVSDVQSNVQDAGAAVLVNVHHGACLQRVSLHDEAGACAQRGAPGLIARHHAFVQLALQLHVQDVVARETQMKSFSACVPARMAIAGDAGARPGQRRPMQGPNCCTPVACRPGTLRACPCTAATSAGNSCPPPVWSKQMP